LVSDIIFIFIFYWAISSYRDREYCCASQTGNYPTTWDLLPLTTTSYLNNCIINYSFVGQDEVLRSPSDTDLGNLCFGRCYSYCRLDQLEDSHLDRRSPQSSRSECSSRP